MILIDSNVLIDLFGINQAWYSWSLEATTAARERDRLIINPITISEVAPRMGALENFMKKLSIVGAEVMAPTIEAAYAAGTAFNAYRARRRVGTETGGTVLPDFLIGGHAQTLGATILTRDARFYRTYFPSVPLITPDEVR